MWLSIPPCSVRTSLLSAAGSAFLLSSQSGAGFQVTWSCQTCCHLHLAMKQVNIARLCSLLGSHYRLTTSDTAMRLNRKIAQAQILKYFQHKWIFDVYQSTSMWMSLFSWCWSLCHWRSRWDKSIRRSTVRRTSSPSTRRSPTPWLSPHHQTSIVTLWRVSNTHNISGNLVKPIFLNIFPFRQV